MTDNPPSSNAPGEEGLHADRVMIAHYPTEFEANAGAIVLRDAGIDVMVLATKQSGAVDQAVAGRRPQFALWINRDDVDRAQHALRDAADAGQTLRDEEADAAEDEGSSDTAGARFEPSRRGPLVLRVLAIIGLAWLAIALIVLAASMLR